MNQEEFKDITKTMEDILINICNINSYLSSFNTSKDEMELEKINKQIKYIHRILSKTNLNIKSIKNSREPMLEIIELKTNIIKNNTKL